MIRFPLEITDADDWPVVLVCGDRARVDAVRQVSDGWPVPTVLTVFARAMPALRHVLSQPVRLVIVEWGVDAHSSRTLVRQLARLRPELLVLAFDEDIIYGSADQVLVWPWRELTTVLDCGMLRLLDERYLAPARRSEA